MLDIKKVLSKNVSKLLDSRPDISRLALSKQMHVADGTLGRIKYGNGNPNIETLEAIAKFFRVEPWQLLVEEFDLKSPPTILSAKHLPDGLTPEEKALIKTVRSLREPERSYLFRQAQTYMEAMNTESDDASKSLSKAGGAS